jgi:curved DNA-binding protein CbpA
MPKSRKLLDVLLDLHKNERSGVLRVERGLEKKQLVLNKGLLVFAESNVPAEHLVKIIVKLNLLPRTKMNEIAALMKSGKTSEEAVLSISGSETQNLEKGRYEQAITILASLLSWDVCEMRFYPGEDIVRYHLNLGLSLPTALVLSARSAASSHLIQVQANFMQGVIRSTGISADENLPFPLNNIETYAYSLFHEPIRAAEVLSLIPSTEGKPEQILLRLFLLGLVEPNEPMSQSDGATASIGSSSAVQVLEDMIVSFESASLYDILSVSPDANPDEIQAAYHQMAKQYHPDRFQSNDYSADARSKAEQVFTHINKAYITLKDPVFRADYDEKRLKTESKVEAELKARAGGQADDEKTAEAIYRDGRNLLSNGDFEKAVEHLKACVWLCPNKAKYNHYLGVAESEIPKLRKSAEQHLIKALELDNASAASRLALARLYIQVALRRKAELQLQELTRWDPENPEVLKLLTELKELEKAQSSQSTKNPFSR